MKAAGFIVSVLLLLVRPVCAEEIALSPEQIKTLGIATAQLPERQSGELAGLPALVVIPGNQLFTVSTPLPAMVEQVLVGVGDNVRKGQALASLQSPALAEVQRGLLQATTQAQLAQENLNRDEQLWKDGIISESRYRATQSQFREAAAVLAERKQMLKLSGMSDTAIAQLQSGNNLNSLLTISSPIDGVVLEKSVNAGQRLDAATPLFKVAKLEPLALEIQAPLASTQGLKTGAAVTIPALNAKGKLTAIGRSLSGGNQTILLRALISEGAASLRPGQYVEASVGTTVGAQAQWTVPNSAIARIGSRSVIFVASNKGFRVENVAVLQEGAKESVIGGKLTGTEKVAIKGVSALKANLMGLGGGE